ncbi:MAG: hypothetical protein AAGE01_18015, partial [Pseudomonadota bacterium]
LDRGFILFTELNHGFINPEAEQYYQRVDVIFADREFWVPELDANAYSIPGAVFTEYLNWSLPSLYAMDQLDEEGVAALVTRVGDSMVERRGFARFREFNEALMRLYEERAAGETAADLYPALLDWAEAEWTANRDEAASAE